MHASPASPFLVTSKVGDVIGERIAVENAAGQVYFRKMTQTEKLAHGFNSRMRAQTTALYSFGVHGLVSRMCPRPKDEEHEITHAEVDHDRRTVTVDTAPRPLILGV